MNLSERPHVRFGTIDTWLLYMLMGHGRSVEGARRGKRLAHEGGAFKTDVSNASQWLFMDLEMMEWDDGLVGAVCGGSGCWEGTPFATLPATAMPEVVPSSDRAIRSVRRVPLGSGEGMALGGRRRWRHPW